MAKQIIWSFRAQNDRKEIFDYWNNRNKSTTFSRKLNSLIKYTLRLISKYPLIGKKTNKENIRIKILKDYLIIYEVTGSLCNGILKDGKLIKTSDFRKMEKLLEDED